LWDLAVPRGYRAAIALKKFAGVPEFRLFAWSAKASPDL